MNGDLFAKRALGLLLSAGCAASLAAHAYPMEALSAAAPVPAAATAADADPGVQVYVAYANNQTAATFFPNPWYGKANLRFLATHGPGYDTGAIMIVNSGSTNVVLSRGASVDGLGNGKVYKVWDGLIASTGEVIAPGGRVVLAQTTTCAQGSATTCSNFNTGASNTGATRNVSVPVIHLTLNGIAQTFSDTGQVLNTGGLNTAASLDRNGSVQWRLVGTTASSLPGGSGVLPAAVSTAHNDNSRTGLATAETTLTTGNVAAATFGKLFAYTVDGTITAQPLFVRDVAIAGKGVHNIVLVATAKDSLYAFDAETDQGGGGLLWGPVSLGTPTAPYGVLSTPVIDTASNTVYLVSKNQVAGVDTALLHALDLSSGAEKFGAPVTVSGSVPGTGDDSSGGQLPFVSAHAVQRPGLLLVGGTLYLAFGSVGDRNPNHGWVFAYQAGEGLAQTALFNTTPNAVGSCDVDPATGQCPATPPTDGTVLTNSLCANTKNPGWDGWLSAGGSIWMSGGGPAADASGIYLTTGNGFFGPGKGNYGDSILKVSATGTPQLQVLDYFTPSNQLYLMCNDGDFGTGAPLLLPGAGASLLVMISKRGDLYLLSRATGEMGQYNPCGLAAPACDHVVQAIGGALGANVTSSPAYFNNAIYAQGSNGTLKKFSLQNGLFSPTTPSAQSVKRFTYPATPSISYDATNSNLAASGIVWTLERLATSPSVLHAYTSDTLRELYRSDTQGARDTLGKTGAFTVPTIAAGKVFVGTTTQLVVYGPSFF